MLLSIISPKSSNLRRVFSYFYSKKYCSFYCSYFSSAISTSDVDSFPKNIPPKSIFGSSKQEAKQDAFSQFCRFKPHETEFVPENFKTEHPFEGKVNSLPEMRDLLIQRFQFSCSYFDAKKLHLEMIRNGFTEDLFLSNVLINIYVRVGDMASAFQLFDKMPDRNLVTWACLISGCTHNGLYEDACRIFREMVVFGFFPNHYAVGSALRACQGLGDIGLKFGLQIHGLALKSPYGFDTVVCNVLISMYGSCMVSPEYALLAFEDIKVKNSVSWNSIISVYSQREDSVSAFELFSAMQKVDSFRATEYTFGSLITVASASCTVLLQQVLAKAVRLGFLVDLYVGSALVSGFSKVGNFDIAKEIFEQMGTRNAASLNGLMVGLVRLQRGEEAFKVFMETRNLVEITCDSLLVLLSAFSEFSSLNDGMKKGRELHAYLIRTGLGNLKVSVGNGLISMYAKCGAIEEACSVFKLMADKDSVSWNSLITGLDQNEHFEDAVLAFCTMKTCGLMPSNFTLISVLSSSGSLGMNKTGEQVHGEGLKLGLDSDISVSNALLAFYADSGCINTCKKVFTLMPKYDVVSWNTILGALSNLGDSTPEAVEHFKEMMRCGWRFNYVTFISLLEAVSLLSLLELCRQVHSLLIKCSAGNDSSIENLLLSCYGKSGGIDECETIFFKMLGRGDEVTWNSMISSYVSNNQLTKAMDLVWNMLQNGQRLDCFTFASVLSVCASMGTLERGMEVHACALRSCVESDIVVGSAVVDMYTKCGRIDYASKFFDLMPVRNVYSWNSMIAGYARHGYGREALDVFSRMKLEDLCPDHVTFVGVLSACSHVGLVDQGFVHFDSMRNLYDLTPKMEHYSCIVDLLARAGELDKLENFVNSMPMIPNVLIWRTVLGACGRANGRRSDLGRRAGQMLLELEPQNAVNYVLLANMHASGGHWENVAKARHAMQDAAARKETGCSWVTMKDGVHVFVSGDKSHPDKDAIYEKLKELHVKMMDAGYTAEVKYALYDLEQENREELLAYHSERIAVAFVLIRPSDRPIRIMKNLRICGDCHSAFKYISQIVGRQIVVRDSNRFHHFSSGKCSCSDYW